MPYNLKKSGNGHKVVSPDHDKGFSKKPLTLRMAKQQLKAIYSSTKGK